MRQCLLTNGILLSDEELYALEERFNDDVGFNYFWFLKEVEPNVQEEPLVFPLKSNGKHLLFKRFLVYRIHQRDEED